MKPSTLRTLHENLKFIATVPTPDYCRFSQHSLVSYQTIQDNAVRVAVVISTNAFNAHGAYILMDVDSNLVVDHNSAQHATEGSLKATDLVTLYGKAPTASIEKAEKMLKQRINSALESWMKAGPALN